MVFEKRIFETLLEEISNEKKYILNFFANG
jgi:hypothetical protein